MSNFRNIPPAGLIVIAVIGALFVLAVILLLYVHMRYRLLSLGASGQGEEGRGFRGALLKEYVAAYKKYGRDVNTSAIITDVISPFPVWAWPSTPPWWGRAAPSC